MNVDFSKYDIQKLSVIGVVTNRQLARMGVKPVVREAIYETAEKLRRHIVEKFVKVEEDHGQSVYWVRGECYVVSSSDLEQIVRDAFEQGAEEARKWSIP